MSSDALSARISVNPDRLRSTAAAHDSYAAAYESYLTRCQDWLSEVEAEVLRCHGAVAAPVGAALAEFGEQISQRTKATRAQHNAMGGKLGDAAAGYERTDAAGAAGIAGA
jgi:hypothetical protein